MPSNLTSLALTSGVCVVLLACDERARAPLAPDRVSSPGSPSLAVAASRSSGGEEASGHADIQGTTPQGFDDQIYSFTAVSTGEFPLAKGQVQADFLLAGRRFNVHARVTCLSIVENQAWVGSRVRRFVIDGEEQPDRVGGPMRFRVQDMGEGHGDVDLAAFVVFGTADDLEYCNTRPDFPVMRESIHGNIQVKPR